jgi:hypothetical protein
LLLSSEVKLGKAMVDKINRTRIIGINLKKAVNDLDRAALQSLLRQVDELDMEEDAVIKEAKRLCFGINEEQLRSLQMERAIESKDEKRVQDLIKICIALKTSNPRQIIRFLKLN